MAGVRIEVDDRALREFAWTLPQVHEGTQALGDAIAEEARRLAPVGTRSERGHRPGTLRDSVATRRTRTGPGVLVEVGVFYGRFVEFGTRFMKAEPFLRPAANKYRRARTGPG